MGKSFYCGFHGRGGVSRLGLASSNNFSRLWGTGTVPRGLMPAPGMIWTTECKILIKEVGGGVGFGPVALQRKAQ